MRFEGTAPAVQQGEEMVDNKSQISARNCDPYMFYVEKDFI